MDGIVLYAVCDDDGSSWLYSEEPTKADDHWTCYDGAKHMKLRHKNLFSKNKPVKLRLIEMTEKPGAVIDRLPRSEWKEASHA